MRMAPVLHPGLLRVVCLTVLFFPFLVLQVAWFVECWNDRGRLEKAGHWFRSLFKISSLQFPVSCLMLRCVVFCCQLHVLFNGLINCPEAVITDSQQNRKACINYKSYFRHKNFRTSGQAVLKQSRIWNHMCGPLYTIIKLICTTPFRSSSNFLKVHLKGQHCISNACWMSGMGITCVIQYGGLSGQMKRKISQSIQCWDHKAFSLKAASVSDKGNVTWKLVLFSMCFLWLLLFITYLDAHLYFDC